MAVRAFLCMLAFLAALEAAGAPSPTAKPPLSPNDRHAEIARAFSREFPARHVSGLALDDYVSSLAWTNYLNFLDYDHVYFLASDIDRFRAHELSLDDALSAGTVDFAFEVFEVFKQRLRDRYTFVTNTLETGFDLEKDETYRRKRRKLPWPADETAWNELWRKRIKNEYLGRTLAAEIKQNATNSPSPPTPEEFISKRYRQVLNVHNDSDAELVLQRYLTAFARAYDPHSEYLSPSAFENFNIEMGLSLVGIGAVLTSEDGMAKILSILPGGPAGKDKRDHRLQVGDRIVAVAQGDDEAVDVLHWPLQRVVGLIRGKKKTKVVLTVIPASDPSGQSLKTVDLERDTVKLEDRAAQSEIRTFNGNDREYRLGVISLPSFYANLRASSRFSPDYRSATRDVARIITEMKEQDIDGLLLDLRSNGGGYLPEAVSMTGLFISTGPVVKVVERGRARVHRDVDFSRTYAGPLVVLLNRLSASATEILAGALQDYGRAVIVGDSRSHGKGTVQAPGPLEENASLGTLKVTVASYYRISGASTQLKGVIPDIVVPSPFDRSDYGEERFDNAMPWSSIESELYTPMPGLRSAIPRLRAKSTNRRKDNERFASYLELLERIKTFTKMDEMPLQIEKRRLLTEQERELAELQRSLLADLPGGTEAEDGKKADPVLDEALTILSDLITIRREDSAKKTGKAGIAKKLLDWILD